MAILCCESWSFWALFVEPVRDSVARGIAEALRAIVYTVLLQCFINDKNY